MAAADFNTEISVKGTKEDYLSILKVLHLYADEREEQYRSKHDCWYLDGKLGEINETALTSFVENGVLSVGFGGPYGVMNGTMEDEVDLFERLADAAPNCSFEGSVSGWDVGAEQGIDAKLENGLLYLRYSYKPFGEDDWDEEEDDWDDEEDEGPEEDWSTIYDPISHKYQRPERDVPEEDGVTVTITVTDSSGKNHVLVLPSDDIWEPTNLKCFPKDLLSAKTIQSIIQVLMGSVEGIGAENRIQEIAEFGEQLKSALDGNSITRLELTKVHNHKEPLFFGWLRASSFAPDLKKMAKSVCTCAEKNKAKNIEIFETYVKNYNLSFPGCEWTGWPEFCGFGFSIPAETGGFSWNPETKAVLDWRGVAANAEEFAHFLCSKEEPREYAIEAVVVDYTAGTTKQTAIYMPGGPVPKTGPETEL